MRQASLLPEFLNHFKIYHFLFWFCEDHPAMNKVSIKLLDFKIIRLEQDVDLLVNGDQLMFLSGRQMEIILHLYRTSINDISIDKIDSFI